MAGPTIFPSLLPEFREERDNVAPGTSQDQLDLQAIARALDDDTCPWCGDESGNVPSHAAQAHPDGWQRYKEA